MEFYVFGFALISIAIIYITKFNIIHPLFMFSVTIAIYGFFGIYLGSSSNLASRFNDETIAISFYYGVAIYIAFLLGYGLAYIISNYLSSAQHPGADLRDDANTSSFLLIPPALSVVLTCISLGGAIALMLSSAGSVNEFLNNLHMRQVTSSGHNWLLFFVLAGRLPIHSAIGRVITERSYIELILHGLIVVTVASIVAGRIFGLLIVLQTYMVYSNYRSIPTAAKLISASIAFTIFFIYGFFRYFQGLEGGSDSVDLGAFLSTSGSDNQNFIEVMQEVMFDSWYGLLSAVDATSYAGNHGNGALTLSQLSKAIPGLYDSTIDSLYPSFYNISEQYDLRYRAISWGAELWLDFGWFGVIPFFGLGYAICYLYIMMQEKEEGFWYTVLYTNIIVYTFLMLRNGLGFVIAFLTIELIWLVMITGLLTTPLIYSYGRRRSTKLMSAKTDITP